MRIRFQFIQSAFAVILFTMSWPSSGLFAQGTAFTYQGRLNDGATPANGNYDLRFTIYDLVSNGTIIAGPLTNATTSVSNGLFTITLDFGNVFPGAARFLEIAVRTNGGSSFTTLAPRQKLTPAPYAVTAESLVTGGLATGTYGSAVNFSNAANHFTGVFTGDGANLTSVNASTLGGLTPSLLWQLGGNNVGSEDFLGSVNNRPVEIRANNLKAMQFAYASNAVSGYSPNLIGGHSSNNVAAGVVGAVISGGGTPGAGGNLVTGDFGTISGGRGNAVANFAVVAGGINNLASNQLATIGGGSGNVAGGPASTVGGGGEYGAAGFPNHALGTGSTVSGGSSNSATNDYATVSGGLANSGLGYGSVVSGGSGNSAIGDYSVVPGGNGNVAGGKYSLAAGRNAHAQHAGAFVWSDSLNGTFSSSSSNQFLIRAAGGVGIGTNSPGAALHVASPSSAPEIQITQQNSSDYTRLRMNVSGWQGSPFWEMDVSPSATPSLQFWNSTLRMSIDYNGNVSATTFTPSSDRNAKENFEPVNARDVLKKVVALPITRWNFKNESGVTHLGPMAQDFHAAFNAGADDRHIATVDADGVALAAIQGLNEKVEGERQRAEDRIQNLEAQNAELRHELSELEALILLRAPGNAGANNNQDTKKQP